MKNHKALNILLGKVKTKRKIAKLVDLTPQAVDGWFKRGEIPVERVLTLEKATGVSRSILRPDIYPHESIDA